MSRIRTALANASYLAAGNTATQLIVLVGFIYIARRLGAENFGVYAIVGAFVTMFTMLTFNGLGKVVVREGSKHPSSLESLYNRVIGVRLLFLVAAMAVCIVSVSFTPYERQVKLFIVLFSFHIFYQGMTAFFSTIYQVVEKMKYISIINIFNRLAFVLLAVGFLHFGFGVLSLIIISLVINSITLICNYLVSRRFVKFNLFSRLRLEKEILKPALSFSLYGIVSILSLRFDLFLISILGTPAQVGIYAVAFRFANQGRMLKNVNAMAFFPVFVRRFHEGSVNGVKLIWYGLGFFFAVLVIAAVFSVFCTDLVILLLGEEYAESGEVLSVLIFYLAALWGTMPFTIAAQATHNENLMLTAQTIMVLVSIPLKYVFFELYGLIGVAIIAVAVWGVVGLGMCIVLYRAIKKQGYFEPASRGETP